LDVLRREVGQMGRRKKMNAEEMEKWLLSQGAVPVTEKMKKEPWYADVSKLPPLYCVRKKTACCTAKGRAKTLNLKT